MTVPSVITLANPIMEKQDQLKAALPMPCQNLEMSQKAESVQAGAVTRVPSCLALTTQRSGYEDITLDSARARLATFLSGRSSEPPEFPAANVALSLSDSPVGVLTQSCCAVTLSSNTDESTAVTSAVESTAVTSAVESTAVTSAVESTAVTSAVESTAVTSTVEEPTLAKTCASVCFTSGGSLPPPGYSQPDYVRYVTGYYGNSCPYGMWVGGPFHMSAGGGWSSPCSPCSPYVPCGSCAPCGHYSPCTFCYSCGPSTMSDTCCYCPSVQNYSPNTLNSSDWPTTVPIAQGAPETIEVPDIPDIPETPPTTSYGSWLRPKTTVVADDDFPDLIQGPSKHESVPGVLCFAPEESAKKKIDQSETSPKPSIDTPLPACESRNKPILNRPTKLT